MNGSADVLDRTEAALAWWRATGDETTSSILGTGAVARLERAASRLLGHRHGLALPSGTAALRAALEAVGIGPGTQVIVPAMDWGAATAAARSLGATVVTARVEAPGMGISAAEVARVRSGRTRAVVVTHLFGMPADARAVRDVLPPGVAVVEDCAQAFGGRHGGRPVGATGEVAVCSFGPGKIVDAGEGGLVATSDDGLFRRLVTATQHPAGQVLRGVDPPEMVNLTARIHPVAAVLACHGLERLDAELAARSGARRHIAAEAPRACPGLRLVERSEGASGWGLPALVPDEHRSVDLLEDAGFLATPIVDLAGPGLTGDGISGTEPAMERRARLLTCR